MPPPSKQLPEISIEQLPDEMWLTIFSFCTPESLVNLFRVNKLFNHLIKSDKTLNSRKGLSIQDWFEAHNLQPPPNPNWKNLAILLEIKLPDLPAEIIQQRENHSSSIEMATLMRLPTITRLAIILLKLFDPSFSFDILGFYWENYTYFESTSYYRDYEKIPKCVLKGVLNFFWENKDEAVCLYALLSMFSLDPLGMQDESAGFIEDFFRNVLRFPKEEVQYAKLLKYLLRLQPDLLSGNWFAGELTCHCGCNQRDYYNAMGFATIKRHLQYIPTLLKAGAYQNFRGKYQDSYRWKCTTTSSDELKISLLVNCTIFLSLAFNYFKQNDIKAGYEKINRVGGSSRCRPLTPPYVRCRIRRFKLNGYRCCLISQTN